MNEVFKSMNMEVNIESSVEENEEEKTINIDLSGSAFDTAVAKYYEMIYNHLVHGSDMVITPSQVLKQFQIIDTIRAQNPL